VRGIEQNAAESHALQSWLQEGSLPVQSNATSEPSAVIGIELANRLGVKRGDVLQVIPAGVNVSATNSMPRRLRVAGTFRSGLFEYDSTWIYLPIEIATSLSGETHAASIISVQLHNPDDVKQIDEQVRQMLGNGYNTIDWQQANQPLFSALALERRMGLFIIGLIIAVAAINISTMLILVVVERRRDIAILSALGAKRRGVMLVFIIEGAIVGLAGALIGTVLGIAACAFGNYYKLVSLPADVYSISNVPLNARVSEVVVAASAAFLLSVLATIYPARAAVKLRPTETFRDAA
jgi:lipoprotein-releasing system permease protein